MSAMCISTSRHSASDGHRRGVRCQCLEVRRAGAGSCHLVRMKAEVGEGLVLVGGQVLFSVVKHLGGTEKMN